MSATPNMTEIVDDESSPRQSDDSVVGVAVAGGILLLAVVGIGVMRCKRRQNGDANIEGLQGLGADSESVYPSRLLTGTWKSDATPSTLPPTKSNSQSTLQLPKDKSKEKIHPTSQGMSTSSYGYFLDQKT
ncbi:hypothetical protein CYMTET_32805 [Cymbomonas tetramitiformis]|uniref:Uncharacterized protein n=1 Tax=Cymbomonas tetramitiformis TaxID=36881 RepID=A0AAE0KRJ2_9CHLO|nr:hypothetical protein CYMTET_32805 [Cymbomonas tetramitiformis]